MIYLFLFYLYGCSVCMYTTSVPGACGSQKKVKDSLKLELKMDVNHHTGT